jgi:hypothetical protein
MNYADGVGVWKYRLPARGILLAPWPVFNVRGPMSDWLILRALPPSLRDLGAANITGVPSRKT